MFWNTFISKPCYLKLLPQTWASGLWPWVLGMRDCALAPSKSFPCFKGRVLSSQSNIQVGLHYTLPLQVHLRSQRPDIPWVCFQDLQRPGFFLSTNFISFPGLTRLLVYSLVIHRCQDWLFSGVWLWTEFGLHSRVPHSCMWGVTCPHEARGGKRWGQASGWHEVWQVGTFVL